MRPSSRGRGMRPAVQFVCAVLALTVVWQTIAGTKRGHDGSHVRFRRLLGLNQLDVAGGSIWPPSYAPAESQSTSNPDCQHVGDHSGFDDSCSFVRAHEACRSDGLLDYTSIFFCTFSRAPLTGLVAFTIWLACLFYMLGNTAADYFCCSLEKMSKLLHLPPTVAGVSLLPLGNGAPDVFSSIAAFMGSGTGDVGLNSVLGGATFVTSVVMGSVSLVIARKESETLLRIDKFSFLRDVSFLLVTLAALLVILLVGKVSLWGAMAYTSIYLVYGVTVAVLELRKSSRKGPSWQSMEPLLSDKDFDMPLLPPIDPKFSGREAPTHYDGDGLSVDPDLAQGFSAAARGGTAVDTSLPQWKWAPHVAIYSHQGSMRKGKRATRPLWGWSEEESQESAWYTPRGLCFYLMEWPLSLPRRLTIPIVEEDRWSKNYAVASTALAPLLLALVWEGEDSLLINRSWQVLLTATFVGAALSLTAYFTLTTEHPPRRFLFPWVFGGFVMSIVWFYIIANELVGALVALGVVLDMDAAILGLTVLAWGNSLGDLVSNLVLANHGGDGVQIAVSGCYAGPMFNTLVGLGASFLLASWKAYPASYSIPNDPSVYYTLGFLITGLLWALWNLPRSSMQPSRLLGIGLLVLYLSFLTLRLTTTIGLVGVVGLN